MSREVKIVIVAGNLLEQRLCGCFPDYDAGGGTEHSPDLTNFEAVNIPTDFSPPTNNGIWTCTSDAVCYLTCSYLGALFDPTQ